jgi:Ca2+/H+ antiporter
MLIGKTLKARRFVVPILVIAGIIIGKPVTLVFTIFELVSIFLFIHLKF